MSPLTTEQHQRAIDKLKEILSKATNGSEENDQSYNYGAYRVYRHREQDGIVRWAFFAGLQFRLDIATTRDFTFLPEHSNYVTTQELFMYLCLDFYDDRAKHGFEYVYYEKPTYDKSKLPCSEEDSLQMFLFELYDAGHNRWRECEARLVEVDSDGEHVYRHTKSTGATLTLYMRERQFEDGDVPYNRRWIIKDEDGDVVAYFYTGPGGKFEEEDEYKCIESYSDVESVYHLLIGEMY